MASAASGIGQGSNLLLHSTKRSIKALSESPDLTSIPSSYAFITNPGEVVSDPHDDPLPIIDYSLLISGTPDQRSKAIHDLGKACEEWGFFMVVNHDIPKTLMEKIFVEVFGFFNLTEEEKQEYAGKHVLDPIRCGTSFNSSVEKVFFWRDFLKIFVHPEFHSPDKPAGFRETCEQYCRRARRIARELLKGISESLGLEPSYIEQALNLDSGLQVFIANFYPPCPQPDMAMGMPPHSDHGLLTLLSQNGVIGLQILHKGKWVSVNAIPNCLVVNVSDHIEILSNGKYKSVLHKAVVSSKATRISIAVANGPSGDTFVVPAAELVKKESNPAAYVGMKYKEYLGLQQSNQLDGKSALDRVRI